ncbi:hypothetical protein MKW98_008021 [Papaver atlanticum]|uniref:O-methyltransferase C-terminal domain-containing protein n=1 Tax=Papaver atlanticum TaxID=357466 RepID=A0AAD4SWH1_9MAGN|nr:hypothetical protein MKW98_008021 [Papaver atlanticum]
MFESIPHADAVLLKFILHDWSDKDCVRILKMCREAIPSREEGGKIFTIDAVIEEDKNKQEDDSITETQLLMDIAVMAIYNSKERTEKEWKKLFINSGFTDYKMLLPFLKNRLVSLFGYVKKIGLFPYMESQML